MFRLAAFIKKWPILSGFLLVLFVLWILPATPDEQANQSTENYGVFRGVKKESATVENADSAFVETRLAKLSEPEYKIYSRAFYGALSQSKAGDITSWQTRTAFGQMRMGENFTNNSGQTCRVFAERYTVASQTQTLSGKACQDKKGVWCKLRNESTPTCTLNEKGGLGMFMEDTTTSIHNMGMDTNKFMYRIKSWF